MFYQQIFKLPSILYHALYCLKTLLLSLIILSSFWRIFWQNISGTGTYLAIFCYLARNGMILTLQLGAAMSALTIKIKKVWNQQVKSLALEQLLVMLLAIAILSCLSLHVHISAWMNLELSSSCRSTVTFCYSSKMTFMLQFVTLLHDFLK